MDVPKLEPCVPITFGVDCHSSSSSFPSFGDFAGSGASRSFRKRSQLPSGSDAIMPAAVAKGIIISISIIAALSIAVLENPQVQSWLEEQRRKIAELLRSVGQDLDPESRRRAEAFAFEGQTTTDVEAPQRESTPSLETVAKATGRSMSSDASTIRRIPIKGPSDKDQAEERRNKGKEYLAKRNQQMIELQERRKTSKAPDTTPLTSSSFDALVDKEGNLRDSSVPTEKELPSPPTSKPVPEHIQQEMKEVERHLAQPILLAESSASGMSGWQIGSELANPFGDEYELDRSMTPRPASPIANRIERAPSPEISIPGAFDNAQAHDTAGGADDAGLTYEEQLAIAMSLSEQESVNNAASVRQRSAKEDADLRRAIQASLKDIDSQRAAQSLAPANVTPERAQQPLVDLTPSTPPPIVPRPGWESFFDPKFMTTQAQQARVPPSAPRSESTDELYSVTPELTRARLASFDAQQDASASAIVVHPQSVHHSRPVVESSQPAPEAMEASFFSAASVISPPSSHTFGNDTPQLIDISDDAAQEGTRTPKSQALSSAGLHTDIESETLGSASASPSRAPSQARSEISAAEVVILEDDSDVDMLSEEGDGIATPDSWSEVGSRDAESEAEFEGQHPSHVSS